MYFPQILEKYVELKILRAILTATKEISVSDLARLSKTNKASVSILLRKLEKDGLLKKSIVGPLHLYEPEDCALIRQLKIFFTIADFQEAQFIDNLLEKNETITSMVLYGSHANGTNDSKSDIDILLLVGNTKKIPIMDIEKKLGKQISVESFTLANWKKTKKKNAPFYDSVIRNHVVLWGGDLP